MHHAHISPSLHSVAFLAANTPHCLLLLLLLPAETGGELHATSPGAGRPDITTTTPLLPQARTEKVEEEEGVARGNRSPRSDGGGGGLMGVVKSALNKPKEAMQVRVVHAAPVGEGGSLVVLCQDVASTTAY